MSPAAKKALITGITGQDGIFLAQFLLGKGYRVTGVLAHGHVHVTARMDKAGLTDKIEIKTCVLTNAKDVAQLLDEIKPDEIYNLAAVSSVKLSFDTPYDSIHFNVLTVTAFLESIRLSGLDIKFYQASSSEMFGNADALPITENTPFKPTSPYAISKVTGHMLVKYYRSVCKVFCCAGILFNHESVLRPPHFVSKKILSAAIRISKGSKEKLSLGNISVKRDWGYAPEYIKAMWLMLQQPEPDDYVIATGEAHSLQEFIEIVFKELGMNWQEHVVIDKDLYRPADIKEIWGDPRKAKDRLGWAYDLSFPKFVSTLVKEEMQ